MEENLQEYTEEELQNNRKQIKGFLNWKEDKKKEEEAEEKISRREVDKKLAHERKISKLENDK